MIILFFPSDFLVILRGEQKTPEALSNKNLIVLKTQSCSHSLLRENCRNYLKKLWHNGRLGQKNQFIIRMRSRSWFYFLFYRGGNIDFSNKFCRELYKRKVRYRNILLYFYEFHIFLDLTPLLPVISFFSFNHFAHRYRVLYGKLNQLLKKKYCFPINVILSFRFTLWI